MNLSNILKLKAHDPYIRAAAMAANFGPETMYNIEVRFITNNFLRKLLYPREAINFNSKIYILLDLNIDNFIDFLKFMTLIVHESVHIRQKMDFRGLGFAKAYFNDPNKFEGEAYDAEKFFHATYKAQVEKWSDTPK